MKRWLLLACLSAGNLFSMQQQAQSPKNEEKPKKEKPSLRTTFTSDSIAGYYWTCPECKNRVRANRAEVIVHLVQEHRAQVPYCGCGYTVNNGGFIMYMIPED